MGLYNYGSSGSGGYLDAMFQYMAMYYLMIFFIIGMLALFLFYILYSLFIKKKIEKDNEKPLDVWQKIGSGGAVSIMTAIFSVFTLLIILEDFFNGSITGLDKWPFVISALFAYVFIAGGLLVNDNSGVGDGAILGGFIVYILSCGIAMDSKNWLVLLVTTLMLAGIIIVTLIKEYNGVFKKFIIGTIVFAMVVMFINFTAGTITKQPTFNNNLFYTSSQESSTQTKSASTLQKINSYNPLYKAISPEGQVLGAKTSQPSYYSGCSTDDYFSSQSQSSCGSSSSGNSYNSNAVWKYIIVMLLAVLSFGAGVILPAKPPINYGLIASGLVMLLVNLYPNTSDPRLTVSITSGITLLVIVGIEVIRYLIKEDHSSSPSSLPHEPSNPIGGPSIHSSFAPTTNFPPQSSSSPSDLNHPSSSESVAHMNIDYEDNKTSEEKSGSLFPQPLKSEPHPFSNSPYGPTPSQPFQPPQSPEAAPQNAPPTPPTMHRPAEGPLEYKKIKVVDSPKK